MSTTTFTSLNKLTNYTNKGADWQAIWDACVSQIYRVVDEEGNNVADCQIRHLKDELWLMVDDMDGYEIHDCESVGRLILVST